MSQKALAHISLSLVALFYGLNYVIAKDVMVKEYMTPFGFIMLRILAGSIIFTTIHYLFVKERMDRKDMSYVALCSVFGALINMLCFFEGLKHTSPIHASLIMVLTPVLVLVVSAFLIKERITIPKIIGIVLGLAGAADQEVSPHHCDQVGLPLWDSHDYPIRGKAIVSNRLVLVYYSNMVSSRLCTLICNSYHILAQSLCTTEGNAFDGRLLCLFPAIDCDDPSYFARSGLSRCDQDRFCDIALYWGVFGQYVI